MESRSRTAVTIADVASMAGVSIATVSRALRGFDNVAPATAERVIGAAQELGYTSNANASMLRAGRSGYITLVVPSVSDWFHSEVMAGVEAVLSDAGYDTLVSVTRRQEDFDRIIAGARPGQSSSDGLIIVEQHLRDSHVSKLESWNCPVVVVGQHVTGLSGVAIEDREVGAVAARHLLSLGHERIGLVQGTGHRVGETSARALRREGFVETLRSHNLTPSPDLEVTGAYTIQGGMQAVARLFAQARPPTAVFCMSDLIALGAIRTLNELGWRTPEDVSVVGVDDHEISTLLGLTTVRQPVSEIAAQAARLLLERLGQDSMPPSHVVWQAELIVRSTTSAPLAESRD